MHYVKNLINILFLLIMLISLSVIMRTNSTPNYGCHRSFEDSEPLVWVGITGQKRCWLEQISGTVHILNKLYEYYPNLGVIFDGWTPSLECSKHHRKEALKMIR